jgi:hypothetical protein
MLIFPEKVLAHVQVNIQPLVRHRDNAVYSPAIDLFAKERIDPVGFLKPCTHYYRTKLPERGANIKQQLRIIGSGSYLDPVTARLQLRVGGDRRPILGEPQRSQRGFGKRAPRRVGRFGGSHGQPGPVDGYVGSELAWLIGMKADG